MNISKNLRIEHNVTLRVLDKSTMKLVREHQGHNAATNTLIEGIGKFLSGAGVLRQGYSRLSKYIPQYISLGTMGLVNQDEDKEGLPEGISGHEYTGDVAVDFENYIYESPGFGADGYSKDYNNNRPYFGLGPAYTSFSPLQSYRSGDIVYYNGVAYVATEDMIVDPDSGSYNYWNSDKWEEAPAEDQPNCWELISPSCPRSEITFRDVVPESESEIPQTVDVIFSAMISTDTFAQFRDSDKDYIFITEAGLWSSRNLDGSSVNSYDSNNLVAGYRLMPSNVINQFMNPAHVPDEAAIEYLGQQGVLDPTQEQIEQAKTDLAEENQHLLKEQVLRVERDQVVQVIWKMQLGNLRSAFGISGTGNIPNGLAQVGDMVYLTINGSPYGTGASIVGKNFTILGGPYATVSALEAAITDPELGDAYSVGASEPYDIYIWNGSAWINYGDIGPITVDSVMSDSSDNAVKNRVIKSYVDGKVPSALKNPYALTVFGTSYDGSSPQNIPIDTTVSNSSPNAIQNKAIKSYIDELVGDVDAAIALLYDLIGIEAIDQALESIDNTIGE